MALPDDLPHALSEYLRKDPLAAHLGIVAEELSLTQRMAVYRVSVIAESDSRRVTEVLARVYRRDHPLGQP